MDPAISNIAPRSVTNERQATSVLKMPLEAMGGDYHRVKVDTSEVLLQNAVIGAILVKDSGGQISL